MTLHDMQAAAYQNKLDHGFNVTDVNLEFNLLYGEVAEAYEAYRKQKADLPDELADILIYLLGLAEILGVDLEEATIAKIQRNQERRYKKVNGVYTRVEGV